MFLRFWQTKRVYGNRRHWCSFTATINWLTWKNEELVGLQNCYLGFSKFWKFLFFLNVQFFIFITVPKSKFQKKTYNMLEGNVSWICVQNFKSISSKMAKIWHKICQKQSLFTSFWDLTVIFLVLFFDRFWCLKKCFKVIFRVLCDNQAKKNMYRSSKSIFLPFLKIMQQRARDIKHSISGYESGWVGQIWCALEVLQFFLIDL